MARTERGFRDGDGRRRFGLLLANALKARGLKQEDLASSLGTTQSSVSGWINGKYEPGAGTVFAIEQTLEMDPGYLSRPLGYLPVEGSSGATVEAAVGQSQVLDDEEKAALLALYDLLARRHERVGAPPATPKPAARVRPGATPGPNRPAATPRASTAARGR